MRSVLVPAHFADFLRPVASECGVALLPYDASGITQADGAASALFRWWLSEDQAERLMNAHPLEWIHTGSAGVDHILTPRFLERSIVLTNSAGVHAPSIAEWVVGMMLAEEKRFREVYRNQRDRVWEKVERDELSGKRVLLIGAGRIAREIAARLAPFEMTITAVARTAREDTAFNRVTTAGELRSEAASSDWLIAAVPLTSDTRGIVSADVIAAMKSTARFVNVSRGEIVDEVALLESLLDRRTAGAVLDVFEEEPLPPDHPFWTMENVVVLPHTTWRSPLVRGRQLELFSDNLRRFVRGEPLFNVVDTRRGY